MKTERLIYICALCALFGAIAWLAVRTDRVVPATASNQQAAPDQPDPFVGVASSELTVEEVVDKQVRSIRAAVDFPERIRECFALASPGNRRMTGPIERFAAMVMAEPYTSLAVDPQWQIGTAVIEGDYAAVLVTTISESGLPSAFRFVLEKQPLPPYEECWMTVAVDFVEVEPDIAALSPELLR